MPPPIICVGSLAAVAILLLLSSGITLDPPPTRAFVQFSPRSSRRHHRRRRRRGDREDNRQHRGEQQEQRRQQERRGMGHDLSSSSSDDDDDDDDCDEEIVESFSRLPSISSSSFQGRHSLYNFAIENEGIMRGMSAMKEGGGGTAAFDVDLSTQENYRAEGNELYGEFREIRAGLDREYHGNYSKARQELQDKIVRKMLDGTTITDETNGSVCTTPTEPWIVFTAGVMGAGKSHTMKQLSATSLFPLEAYVVVDPDEIRSHFPEYHLYAQSNPRRAGELTHREAGYVTEIVTAAALRHGYNVLVDGSLRDYEWYREYFAGLRAEYGALRIAILHITAPKEAVFERAAHRARETGRVVPLETLVSSLEQVPVSIKMLAPLADFFCELDNSHVASAKVDGGGGDVRIMTEGITWDSFRDIWAQTCPWVPPSSLYQPEESRGNMMGKI